MVATATLPVSKIKVRKGHNVRQDVNSDPGFVESIRELGVLVPLIVEQDGDDVYLVAGHRRLAAAQKAGLKDVPVTVQGDSDREAVAAAENISRAQLNPVEEANAIKRLLDSGLTEKGVQDALGVSPKWITQRKKVLAVGDGWHESIARGELNAAELDNLVAVYEISPEFGDEVLAYTHRQIKEGYNVDLDRGHSFDAAAAASKKFRTLGRVSGMGDGVKEAGLTKAAREKLPTLTRKEYGYDYPWKPEWTEVDADRFRAAGVLIRVGGRDGGFGQSNVVTDVALYRQVLSEKIEAYEPPKKQAAKKAKGKADETDADRRKRERRAKLNDELKEAQAQARDFNRKLGVNLLKKLSTVELTADVAKHLVDSVMTQPDRGYGIGTTGHRLDVRDVAHGGLRYIFDDYQTVEERGKAKRKVTVYDDAEAAEKKAVLWFNAAKTPGEQIGRLLIAEAACLYAIDEVVPHSQRFPNARPNERKALAKIAKRCVPRGLEATQKKIAELDRKLSDLRKR